MSKLIYQVYTGTRSRLYDYCTTSVKQYAEQIGADYICQRNPILMIRPDPFTTNRSRESYEKYGGFLPIYEKENAFTYFRQYNQIAIIDADVWIRPDSPDVFAHLPVEYDFGGVVERQMPITTKYAQKIANYSRMQYGTISTVDWRWNDKGAEFFNMGVMILNKSFAKYLNGETPAQFLRRPKFKPFVDGLGPWKWSTDQTLLNVFIREENMKIKHMDWRWNGLYTAIDSSKVKQCYFVHFFLKDLLPNKGEDIEKLMANV